MSSLKKVRGLRTLSCSTFTADRAGSIICDPVALNISVPRKFPNLVCLRSSDIWMPISNVLKMRGTSRANFKTIFCVMVYLLDSIVRAALVTLTVILLESGNSCCYNKLNFKVSSLNGVVANIHTSQSYKISRASQAVQRIA